MSRPACPHCTRTMTFVSESGGMPKLERYRCTPCRITASIELNYEYDDQPPDSPRLETRTELQAYCCVPTCTKPAPGPMEPCEEHRAEVKCQHDYVFMNSIGTHRCELCGHTLNR